MSQTRSLLSTTDVTVTLGAIICFSSGDQLEDSVEIGLLPDLEETNHGWSIREAAGEVMGDGWTR